MSRLGAKQAVGFGVGIARHLALHPSRSARWFWLVTPPKGRVRLEDSA